MTLCICVCVCVCVCVADSAKRGAQYDAAAVSCYSTVCPSVRTHARVSPLKPGGERMPLIYQCGQRLHHHHHLLHNTHLEHLGG